MSDGLTPLEDILQQIETILEQLQEHECNEDLFLAIELAHQLRDEVIQSIPEPFDEF